MSTFITELPATGQGPRVAVKDLIDVEGVPTTAGSRAVAIHAMPALADAPLLRGVRAGDCAIVGKANLHELAFGTTGINPWAGTPENPLDPTRIPGGSSSGSAVAVASGAADLAIGSDTGGSIRIPAAFCGVCGLKTTYGRISLEGVWPLAPSFDTIGPMARDVSGVEAMMALLEAGFVAADGPASSIARLRLPGEEVDEEIDRVLDEALRASEIAIGEGVVPEWGAACASFSDLLLTEAARSNRAILEDPARAELVDELVRERLQSARAITAARTADATNFQRTWRHRLEELLGRFELLALPSVGFLAPSIDDALLRPLNRMTSPVNLAGLPALSMPVPIAGCSRPASLQLVGRAGAEELLVATALVLERTIAR